jgi:hypothetical protein
VVTATGTTNTLQGESGLTFNGSTLSVSSNAQVLNLIGTDHVYAGFYPDGLGAGRKAYIGYGGATSDNLTIANETGSGHIVLSPASGQSVGIGATPAFTAGSGLEIQQSSATSTLRLDSAVFATELRGLTDGTQLYQLSAGYLDLGTSNTTRMRITSAGNVGIGTTSPSYTLDVSGTIGLSGFPFAVKSGNYNQIYEPSGTGSIYLGNTTDSSNYYYNSQHYFRNRNGSTTYVYINSSGNVGIGTTSPNAPLQFATSTATRKIVLYEGANNNYQFYGFGVESATLVYSTYTTGDDHVFFAGTGASSRSELMRIKGSGNVGIGTTSPSNGKLEIAGSANSYMIYADPTTFDGRAVLLPGRFFVGTYASGYPEIGYNYNAFNSAYTKIANDTSWRITFGINNRMDFAYAAAGTGTFGWTTHVSINTSGNVGIGTTSPGYRLDVNGNTNANGIILGDDSTYGSPYKVVGFNSTSDGGNRILAASNANDGMYFMAATGCGFVFRVNGGTTNNIVITSGGNVGIAQTSPYYKLDTNGDVGIVGSNYLYMGHTAGTGTNWTVRTRASSQQFEVNANGLNFNNTGYGGTVTWLYGNSSGNVGIGTTSPVERLTVANTGTSDILSVYRTQSTASNLSGIVFAQQNASGTKINYAGIYSRIVSSTAAAESGDISFYTYNAGSNAQRAAITYVGTFYVGSAIDSAAVSSYVTGYNGFGAQVSNNAYFTYSGLNASGTRTFAITGAGTLTVSADVVAYGTPSDIRYKHDIHQLTNALDTVQKLRGVTFKWKEDTDSYKMTNISDDIGFIAQEVREVLPTIVRENEDGKLSLRDRAIIPLLVEAIKELKAEIDTLKHNS